MKTFLMACAWVVASFAATLAFADEVPVPQGFIDAGLTDLQPVMSADGETVLYWTAVNDTDFMNSNGQTLSALGVMIGTKLGSAELNGVGGDNSIALNVGDFAQKAAVQAAYDAEVLAQARRDYQAANP